jgi:hypothetical protein
MNSSLKQPPPVKKSLNDCLMKDSPALVDLFTVALSFREHRYIQVLPESGGRRSGPAHAKISVERL